MKLFLALMLVSMSANSTQVSTYDLAPIEIGIKKKSIIDMHSHVACLPLIEKDYSDCFVSDRLKKSFKFKMFLHGFGVTQKELKQTKNMAVFNQLHEKIETSEYVKSTVVLALDAPINLETGKEDWDNTEFYVSNEFVIKGIKQFNDHSLSFGASINPYRKDALKRLDYVKENGAVLVKWIPSIMNIDPSDEKLIPFYKKLVRLDLPLLIHTGQERTFTRATDDLADPMKLKLPLSIGVKIIAAHMATTGTNENESNLSRLRSLFMDPDYNQNLYADISATTQANRVTGFTELIKDPIFENKIVYGTDWPLIDVKIFSNIGLTPYQLYNSKFFGKLLSLKQIIYLMAIKNSFDQDIILKYFLGTPLRVFSDYGKLFNADRKHFTYVLKKKLNNVY